MADKPPFDPNQPFKASDGDKPPFDPSQPFQDAGGGVADALIGVAKRTPWGVGLNLLPTESIKKAVSNVPGSAMKFGEDIIQPFIHPVQTYENVRDLGHGVMQKLGIMSGTEDVAKADAVGKFLKDRYGSASAVLKTLETDPVGLAADVSMVLSGGGTAVARAPGIVGRVGEVAATAGRAIDPLVGAGKVLKAGGQVAAETIGRYGTHTGGAPIKIAAQAGFEGGSKADDFLAQLRGTEPMRAVVDEAEAAVNVLRQERGAEYRSGMHDISKDKTVLDFNDIDKALADATNVATFHGQVVHESTQQVRQDIAQAIQKWKLLDPAVHHTPEGLDALKKQIGDIGGVGDKTKYGTPQHKVASDIYRAIGDTIRKQAPAYGKIMKGYEEASEMINEIERTLSLKPQATVDTALGKLQATLRNNVNSRYGYRKDLAEFLAQAGAKNLMEKLAGQALREFSARGLGAKVGSEIIVAALAALGLGHPQASAGILLALPFMSPRVMGEGAFLAGKAARRGPEIRAGGQTARQVGQVDNFLSQNPGLLEPPQQPTPATGKQSSLNPDEGRIVSDVDTRPIAGQQYAMMNEDDLRNPGQRRPLATPMFGGPGAGPSKPVNQLPPVQPRPANQNVKAPRASNENVLQDQVRGRELEQEIGLTRTKLYETTNANEEAILAKRLRDLEARRGAARKPANENVLSAGSHQRPIPEQYKEAKSFLQRIRDNTKDMNRSEILQSEPLWGGARQLSEGGKMSFRDAFHLLTEQITGYGLTPQEWAKIAEQAMKYGIR